MNWNAQNRGHLRPAALWDACGRREERQKDLWAVFGAVVAKAVVQAVTHTIVTYFVCEDNYTSYAERKWSTGGRNDCCLCLT